jgi:peptidoglycan lytic transglycosylase G
MKKFLLVVFLLILISGAAVFVHIRKRVFTPYKGYAESKIAVTIHPGTSVNAIANTLHRKGIIPHPWYLKGIFIWQKTEGQSKAGDYAFDRPMSPWEVYEKLMKGEMQYTVVTVPEGSNVFDVENIFDLKEVGRREDFRMALDSSEVAASLKAVDSDIKDAEGFLFPNTYFFTKRELDARTGILFMIKQFQKEYGPAERSRAAELKMSTLQIVTLASLIEKETGQPSERSLISGVFHNRLKKSMLLQCDPTVIYAMMLAGNYDGHISRADLKFSSAYNTYVAAGLPPGPICNPGKESIKAALFPQQTTMLYFVSRNDGSHYFSSTLQEHNRAVQQYQRRMNRQDAKAPS